MTKTKASRREDARINRIFNARCSNIQLPIMETIRIFKVGREAIAEGVDDQVLGDKMLAYAQSVAVKG